MDKVKRLSFPAFCKEFKRIFGFWDQKMLDATISTMDNLQVHIDIMEFDDWLHKKFGDYKDDNKSMKDIIREKFGNTAVTFIENHI